MDINDLINQIAAWRNTLIGAGYKNQHYPNHYLKGETEQFFLKYPVLQQDEDYVEFIEYYSGLLMIYPNQELIVSVYGLWSDYVTNILYPDEPLLVENQYFNFASVVIDSTNPEGKTIAMGFAFDLETTGKPVVFRRITTENQGRTQSSYLRYCDNFLEWLKILVESSGRMTE